MKNKIALKLCKGIIIPEHEIGHVASGHSISFVAEMMKYGYMPNANLIAQLEQCSVNDLTSLYLKVIPVLKESVGANVKHKPLFPNFPKQVMDMDEATLATTILCNYLKTGTEPLTFNVNKRPVSYEGVTFKTLGVATESMLDNTFTKILSSADSISSFNKEVLEWFVVSGRKLNMPDSIPFKENVCLLASILIENNKWNSDLVKNTTDVLRIVTALNDGDISLADNTKFKSLPRRVRKSLINDLERVAKEEDFMMHKGKWVKLLHNLHVGDYSKKLFAIAKKLRENIKIETFNSKLEAAMHIGDITTSIKLMKTRPGIFARRIIDLLYKDIRRNPTVIKAFAEIVDDVPARNLTQLWGALKTRNEVVKKRVIFPKGSVSKAYVLRNELARLKPKTIEDLLSVIDASLATRFAEKEDLGKVYIDPALYECPLPTGMRSASEGLFEVARGTRLPIGNKSTLRFFIYWKGQDIDLSATFHDENFKQVGHVSYTNTRSSQYKSCHSGDITNARNGASEFIDVDIASILNYDASYRYVAMNVYVYSGPTFAEHEECFAGWMTRNSVNSNEIFEPKTVQQKVDLRSQTKNVIPVMFDLVDRKAIWTDVAIKKNADCPNNVENHAATTQDMVEAFASLDNKISLGELFEVHGKARGQIVKDKEDADSIYSLDEGTTPFDVIEINADYL